MQTRRTRSGRSALRFRRGCSRPRRRTTCAGMMRRKSAWSGGALRTREDLPARAHSASAPGKAVRGRRGAAAGRRCRPSASGMRLRAKPSLTIDTAPCLFLGTHAVLRLNGEHYVEEIGKKQNPSLSRSGPGASACGRRRAARRSGLRAFWRCSAAPARCCCSPTRCSTCSCSTAARRCSSRAGTSVLVWATRLFARHRGLWGLAAAGVAALAVWLWRPGPAAPEMEAALVAGLERPAYAREIRHDRDPLPCGGGGRSSILSARVRVPDRLGGLRADHSASGGRGLAGRPCRSGRCRCSCCSTRRRISRRRSGAVAAAWPGAGVCCSPACSRRPSSGCYALLQPHMDAILALPRRVQGAVLPGQYGRRRQEPYERRLERPVYDRGRRAGADAHRAPG